MRHAAEFWHHNDKFEHHAEYFCRSMNMLDNYKILTITHHNLNVDEIGNFVVHHDGKDDLQQKLSHLKSCTNLDELIYLSTCNRVSFICYSNEEFDLDYIKSFFKCVNPKLDEDSLKKISKFVDVEITEALPNSLRGRLVL